MTESLDPVTAAERPELAAAVDLLYRTGASQVAFQPVDVELTATTSWIAAATWTAGTSVRDRVLDRRGIQQALGFDPLGAVLRPCSTVIDGGTCTHCGHGTAFDEELTGAGRLDDLSVAMLPAHDRPCVYTYDPELRTFRRGCEGDAP